MTEDDLRSHRLGVLVTAATTSLLPEFVELDCAFILIGCTRDGLTAIGSNIGEKSRQARLLEEVVAQIEKKIHG